MPDTAKKHFDEDFARAGDLCTEAEGSTVEPLRSDLARSAVVFAVGALDAYLCDAFVDSLARQMKVSRRAGTSLPSGYAKLELPAGPLLSSYKARPNWGLRMAAREMMEKDNMLQLARLKDLLNPVLPTGEKLWFDTAPQYIVLNRKRLSGISAADFGALTGQSKAEAQRKAAASVLRRIGQIVQRRHDIAHNCDRPKSAPQEMKPGSARNMLTDVGSFISVLDTHLTAHRLV